MPCNRWRHFDLSDRLQCLPAEAPAVRVWQSHWQEVEPFAAFQPTLQ